MLLNLLINYYLLKELHVKITIRKYSLNWPTKMPDLADLPALQTLYNYGKTRI